MPELTIIRGEQEVRKYRFSGVSIVTIGRARTNDVCLSGNNRISRYHAALVKVRGKNEYFIRDLGSLSFTKVRSGERRADYQIVYRKLLEDGDIIKIEDYLLRYSKGGEPSVKIIFNPDKVEEEEASDDMTYYRLLVRGVPPRESQEISDILRRINASSSFPDALRNVLDPMYYVFHLKVIVVARDTGGFLEHYASRGIDEGRGAEINVPCTEDAIEKEDYICTGRALVIPLKAVGSKDTKYIMYLEKKRSAGEFTEGDISSLTSIAHSLCRKISSKDERDEEDRAPEVSSTEFLDWSEQMIWNSEKMKSIWDEVKRISPSESAVLILGETGTGKEELARAIWRNSARKSRPFEVLDCTNIPETLAESELFGHEKGAFTGATSRKKGKVELADGGTLFLDEIGDLPTNIQSKLLRFIETKEFKRLGGTETLRVDTRILAATNKDPFKGVRNGQFRLDLLQRFNYIALPPLRERREDIPLLAHFFLDRFAKKRSKNVVSISHGAMNVLRERYEWPGNVRELRRCIESIVDRMPEGRTVIFQCDLPEYVREESRSDEAKGDGELKPLKQVEKEYIERVLSSTNGNRTEAAGILGISRQTLIKKIRDYSIKL